MSFPKIVLTAVLITATAIGVLVLLLGVVTHRLPWQQNDKGYQLAAHVVCMEALFPEPDAANARGDRDFAELLGRLTLADVTTKAYYKGKADLMGLCLKVVSPDLVRRMQSDLATLNELAEKEKQ